MHCNLHMIFSFAFISVRNMEFWVKTYFFILCGVHCVASFSWSNCGDSTEPIKILSLSAYSNQTKTFYVTGRGKTAVNLTSPIQAQVDMQKKFFWGWTKIPCVEQVGSCIYEDICDFSPYKSESCPEVFDKNKIPCKCPILQGQYAVKKFPLNLDVFPQWLEKGYYRIMLTLRKSGTRLMCVLIYITI